MKKLIIYTILSVILLHFKPAYTQTPRDTIYGFSISSMKICNFDSLGNKRYCDVVETESEIQLNYYQTEIVFNQDGVVSNYLVVEVEQEIGNERVFMFYTRRIGDMKLFSWSIDFDTKEIFMGAFDDNDEISLNDCVLYYFKGIWKSL